MMTVKIITMTIRSLGPEILGGIMYIVFLYFSAMMIIMS